ncbi:hypothetical protein BKA62DRAFT_832381 [Auriculariales sp. MPI-PUGE-AT-0066]|nr:hypothetical protein BKA62DRAFT_832381 [Auriculariales sp. MPI-PUGE-AT-0066]
MSDSSFPLPAAEVPRPYSLPDVVMELQRSVNELELAAKALSTEPGTTKEARDSARKLAEHAVELVAAVVAACNERPGALHVLAVSHLTVFKDTVDESMTLIQTRLAMSQVDSLTTKWNAARQIQTWSLGIAELGAMLKIDKGVAQLVLDPARCLELSNAKPDIDLSKLNPSTSKVVYDGFKIVLEGMANMTDGAPWPWKAIPQTILQFAKLVERSLDLPDKVHDLIKKISQRIAILFNVFKEDASPHQSELTSFVEVFFADMQRIIIRLRIVEKTHPAKVFLLTDRVNEILEDESAMMQEALIKLQTHFLAHTSYTVESISACVIKIQSAVDTALTVTSETRTEVQFIGHVVQETVHNDIGAVHEGIEAMHAVVTEISDDRESNVDVSIQISLDLLQGMHNGTEGQRLLSICAHLPDGLRPSVFDKLDDQFDDIRGARGLLVKLALVSRSPENELKMLSPVRHFVLKHHPMAMNHTAALRKIYFDIAASGPKRMDENFSRLAQNVAPEYGNLTSFLLHLISIEEPSQELFDAIEAVSEYAYWTVPSTTLCEAFRQRLDAHPVWLAPCLRNVARTQLRQNEYALAVVNLNAARKLYTTLGDKFQEAVCGQLLGKCLRMQNSLEAAERELLAAKDTFIELGDETTIKQKYILPPRETFSSDAGLGAAQCTQRLGTIQVHLGNVAGADAEFQSALSEFEALAELTGMANCAVNLADLRVRQNEYDSAEKYLATAREIFKLMGDRSGLANCHQSLGHLSCNQGRLQDATEHYSIAEEIFTAIGIQSAATKCRELIATLRSS